MESEPVDELPAGQGWQYEPKWDGFRCLAFKDGLQVDLRSRNTKPLGRYFPEVVAELARLPADRFVLDGELIIAKQPFDTLQLRLHPAESRITMLSEEHPATFASQPGIDLVFSDVRMPGRVDGLGLAEWLRRKHPGVEIILTSAVPQVVSIAKERAPGAFIEKPCSLEAFAAQIKKLIGC